MKKWLPDFWQSSVDMLTCFYQWLYKMGNPIVMVLFSHSSCFTKNCFWNLGMRPVKKAGLLQKSSFAHSLLCEIKTQYIWVLKKYKHEMVAFKPF